MIELLFENLKEKQNKFEKYINEDHLVKQPINSTPKLDKSRLINSNFNLGIILKFKRKSNASPSLFQSKNNTLQIDKQISIKKDINDAIIRKNEDKSFNNLINSLIYLPLNFYNFRLIFYNFPYFVN